MTKSYEKLKELTDDINNALKYGRKRAENMKSGKLKLSPELAQKRRTKYLASVDRFIRKNKIEARPYTKSPLKDLEVNMKPFDTSYSSMLLIVDFMNNRQKKISKVMHEWKTGKLKTSYGKPVKSRSQAVAISLSEANKNVKTRL